MTTEPELEVGWGILAIGEERSRQLSEEGWTPEHDDLHRRGTLAIAGALYALPMELRGDYREPVPGIGHLVINLQRWLSQRVGWRHGWFKPSPDDRIRELAKAGALIAAEIDRLHREAVRQAQKEKP